MPEGPEVRNYRDDLRKYCLNKKIIDVAVLSGRYLKNKIENLDLLNNNELLFTTVDSKGKFLYFKTNNEVIMFNTLGMTGSWSDSFTKHSRVQFKFIDNTSLFFNDIRNFGTIKFTNSVKELEQKINDLGVDILDNNLSNDDFLKLAHAHAHMNVTEFLMNQKNISGVGNYIKCEALYKAKISPNNLIKDIDNYRLILLFDSIKKIAEKSYLLGGSTFRSYKNFDGKVGDYSQFFEVYGRKYDPDFNSVIKTNTVDKRSTYWVPKVQF